MATSSFSTLSWLTPCNSFLQHQCRHVAAPSKLGRRLLIINKNVANTSDETTTAQLNLDALSGSINSHTLNMEVIQVRHQAGMVDHIRSSIVREEPLECLATIDMLQTLGIDYHFQDEIDFLLQQHSHYYLAATQNCDSLFSAALSFRLVRQHGQFVPIDVFHHFMNDYKEALGDVKGLLALHEASYLGMEGEEVLDQVCSLSRQLLLETSANSSCKSKQLIMNTLHHPRQRSLTRFNLNHYLQTVNEDEGRQLGLTRVSHELAKIDYDVVQSMYRRELELISSWWAELDMSKNLAFARESPMEWFICSVAILSNPSFSNYRVALAKSIAFIYIIDDIYDVYGTIDQLTAFTEAINGWDSHKLKDLPQCMQTSFAALSNILNEVANMVIKEHGWNPLPTFRKLWSGLCDAFLEEAKWFASDSMPNSREYLRNGSMSTGVPLLLAQVSIMLGSTASYNNTMDLLRSDKGDLFSSASRVFRLSDDLSSSTRSQGGHDGCYLDYYMKEKDGTTSLESAIDHVKNMISGEWKSMNRECLAGKFSQDVMMASLNVARLGQWLYPCDNISRHGATMEEFHSLLEDLQL